MRPTYFQNNLTQLFLWALQQSPENITIFLPSKFEQSQMFLLLARLNEIQHIFLCIYMLIQWAIISDLQKQK